MMSREEYQEQHERISSIAVTVDETSQLIKKLIKIWPAISVVGILLGGLAGFIWGVFVYNASLVKQPEYKEHLKVENNNTAALVRYHVIDSTKIEVNVKRLDKLESAPKYRTTRLTAQRDKNGNVTFNPIN